MLWLEPAAPMLEYSILCPTATNIILTCDWWFITLLTFSCKSTYLQKKVKSPSQWELTMVRKARKRGRNSPTFALTIKPLFTLLCLDDLTLLKAIQSLYFCPQIRSVEESKRRLSFRLLYCRRCCLQQEPGASSHGAQSR